MPAFQRFQGRTIVVAGTDGPLSQAIAAAFHAEQGTVISVDSETSNVVEEHKRIDVLVLVPAAENGETSITELQPVDWNRSVTQPLEKTFSAAQQFVSVMKRQGGGTILLVCTGTSRHGSDAYPGCSVLHAALRHWIRCLAVQTAPDRIRCNTVLYEGLDSLPRTGADTASGKIKLQTPYLPYPGTVEDVAQAALFLADDDTGFCVGAELAVDGGIGAGANAYSGDVSIGNAIMENIDAAAKVSKSFDPSKIDLSAFDEPLEPQTVLVTGVSKGLGRVLVEKLIAKGHTVLGCARSEKAIEELRNKFGGPDKPHRFETVDAADRNRVVAWAEALKAEGIVPDFVLNNAAILGDEQCVVWKFSAEAFELVIRVNIMSAVNTIHAFVPMMLRRMKGVIVNFSSGWGREAAPRIGPYAVSKWGVEGLSRVLAAELPNKMCCVSLHPGIIHTESMSRGFGESAKLYPTPEQWVEVAVPFLLSLGPKDNGKAVSVPGMTEFRGMGSLPK